MNSIFSNPALLLIFGSLGGFLISQSGGAFKAALTFLKTRFFHSVTIEQGSDLYKVVNLFVQNNWPGKCRSTTAVWNKASKLTSPVFSPSITIFAIQYRGKKLLIDCGREKMDKADGSFGLYFGSIKISGLFAKEAITELLRAALSKYGSDRPAGAVGVFIRKGWDTMGEVNEVFPKPLHSLIYKCNIHRKIKKDLDIFLSSEKWYADRGITYKRCYCLYGPPGTGKTSMILSIARELRRDVYLLDLAAISTEEEFIRAMSDIPISALVVFEDIDRILGKEGLKLSISSLLNILDGPFSKKGMIIFMTTNHINRIDAAIMRDGRIDVKEHIGLAGRQEVEAYLRLFYELEIELSPYLDIELPMATVQEMCIRHKSNPRAAISQISAKAIIPTPPTQ